MHTTAPDTALKGELQVKLYSPRPGIRWAGFESGVSVINSSFNV